MKWLEGPFPTCLPAPLHADGRVCLAERESLKEVRAGDFF